MKILKTKQKQRQNFKCITTQTLLISAGLEIVTFTMLTRQLKMKIFLCNSNMVLTFKIYLMSILWLFLPCFFSTCRPREQCIEEPLLSSLLCLTAPLLSHRWVIIISQQHAPSRKVIIHPTIGVWDGGSGGGGGEAQKKIGQCNNFCKI